MPGMVNTRRGGAVNIHDDTILWSKNDNAPPIPLCKQAEKHIHFTSTLCHPVQSNLFDLDDENSIIGHSGNPFISNPGNPFVQQPVRSQIPAQTTVDTDATTIIGNTMSIVASEFKKMKEPNSPNSRVELHLGHLYSSIAGLRTLGLLFWSSLCLMPNHFSF